MQVLTAIGEVGIEAKGRLHKLRPSFFAMSQIGSPTEIVEATATLLSPDPVRRQLHPWIYRRFIRARFEWALSVCYACAESPESAGELFGGVAPGFKYRPGLVPPEDIVLLAKGLIRHGVLGNVLNAKPSSRRDYLKEFVAEKFVAEAMAHLNAGENDAWQMTMTSFIAAMRSKFPPAQEKASATAPNKAELTDLMEWAKRLGKA